jgi:quinohemoprotein ethanol dehydrogenase
MWNGGTAATAGDLVFQGDADGVFHAYDARDGKHLWQFDAKLGIVGAPIVYEVSGTEYVSVLVGFGGATALQSGFLKTGWKYNLQPRRLLTFALGKMAPLPPTPPPDLRVNAVDDQSLIIDHSAAVAGAKLYAQKACVICHGLNLSSTGVPGPDLRESALASDRQGFATVVTSGVLMKNGMPRYEELSPLEIDALFMYIREGARNASRGVSTKQDSDSGQRF